MPHRLPIHWPDGARLAVIPCVALETWPEDVGAPNARFAKDLSATERRRTK